MIYSTLEAIVADLAKLSRWKVVKEPSNEPISFDFGLEMPNGTRIAVEVKARASEARVSTIIDRQLPAARKAGYKEFWIVTPEAPKQRLGDYAILTAEAIDLRVRWLSINELAKELDVPLGNFDSWVDLWTLRIGARGGKTSEAWQKGLSSKGDTGTSAGVPPQLAIIKNQLPPRTDVTLRSPTELDQLLGLGSRYETAIAVMSDIKSFTTIVQNADPESLNEMLSKYYSIARQLVISEGGVFDKFIGDAVLAVFNYPAGAEKPFSSALRFSVKLIKEGRALLTEFFRRSVAIVETGTRVGIASGEVWPINVGGDPLQISFIGHTINLAARLQHVAEVDGLLMCQKTSNLFEEENPNFATALRSQRRIIRKGELSGIGTDINTHAVSAKTVSTVDLSQHA